MIKITHTKEVKLMPRRRKGKLFRARNGPLRSRARKFYQVSG